ncbi:MAG TPA: hypothetical protein VFN51_01815 [Candidatus Saccharimonadales bacterium]|nr:hypothetical protein [Candidatus Saccharimonadales bacterium]
MSDTSSERRLTENEATFRKLNEQVNAGFRETNRLAVEDNQPEFKVSTRHDSSLFSFYCECADENCAERISMTLAEYKNIHKNRKRFVIVPGHEVKSLEKVVMTRTGFTVVEKFTNPPEQPEKLNPTSVNNQ